MVIAEGTPAAGWSNITHSSLIRLLVFDLTHESVLGSLDDMDTIPQGLTASAHMRANVKIAACF